MKKCTKCKIEKPLTEFSKHKITKDGYKYQCKVCNKKYYQDNAECIKESVKKSRQNNAEYYKDYDKRYRKDNAESRKKYLKEYRQDNKERTKEYNKKYYQDNAEYYKKYYQDNKERLEEQQKKYKQDNKERIKEYNKKRKQTDPLFKLKCNLRTRTWSAFKRKGYSKTSKTREMLGVDWEIAKAHIERQFTEGMNWDNQGEWHIDHIIPLCSANTKEEMIKLCHYTNLQPLWAEENLSKGDKILKNTQIKFRI